MSLATKADTASGRGQEACVKIRSANVTFLQVSEAEMALTHYDFVYAASPSETRRQQLDLTATAVKTPINCIRLSLFFLTRDTQ